MHRGTLLVLCVLLGPAAGSAQKTISDVPSGKLNGNVYENQGLGVVYEFPANWTAAIEPSGPQNLDPRGHDKPANRCTKILVWLSAPGKTEGRFSSIAALLVIDPACMDLGAFPTSLDERDQIVKVARAVGGYFSFTPFMSPYGNRLNTTFSQNRVVLETSGGMIINALIGPHPKSKEPLAINTSFNFTQAGTNWVAWAYVADEPSTEALKAIRVTLSEPAKTQ